MTTSKLTLDFSRTAHTISTALELITDSKRAPGETRPIDRDAIAFELATLLDNLYTGVVA